MKNLTSNELEQLKGGIQSTNTGDVLNKNSVSGCICNYLNSSVVKNDNKVEYCSCICHVLPSQSK